VFNVDEIYGRCTNNFAKIETPVRIRNERIKGHGKRE